MTCPATTPNGAQAGDRDRPCRRVRRVAGAPGRAVL